MTPKTTRKGQPWGQVYDALAANLTAVQGEQLRIEFHRHPLWDYAGVAAALLHAYELGANRDSSVQHGGLTEQQQEELEKRQAALKKVVEGAVDLRNRLETALTDAVEMHTWSDGRQTSDAEPYLRALEHLQRHDNRLSDKALVQLPTPRRGNPTWLEVTDRERIEARLAAAGVTSQDARKLLLQLVGAIPSAPNTMMR
jgi:hypothetical protein